MKEFVPSTLVEKYFAAISAIPRPSEHEKAVSDYVVSIAQDLGLPCTQDRLGNVVVYKAASAGREAEAPVMLQAHLDMVAVSAPGSSHNFLRDPLQLFVDEKGNLRAKDTTLGADDGYGTAYLLAAMTEQFSHPTLECVFTVQEENGCYGAQGLDASLISSRRMIGLDTMGQNIENTCCVSCYCSDRLTISGEPEIAEDDGKLLCIHLSGVQPVRTGALVHPEQGNAVKIMTRLLKRLPFPVRLCLMKGGEAENYNPVECDAVISLPGEINEEEAENSLRTELKTIDSEINEGTQDLQLTIRWEGKTRLSISHYDTKILLNLLDLIPSGTCEISPKDGSMIATNNIGIADLNVENFRIVMSDRAKDPGCLDGINRRVAELCEMSGCSLAIENRYLPWVYRPDSPLLQTTAALMKEQWGEDMVENICPGGLELCDFLVKIPDLDCVMFAPIGGECHSTSEWMNLASFNRMYRFLKDLLAKI